MNEKDEIIKIKRTKNGIEPVIGQEVHVRDEEGLVFLVKVIGITDEFVEAKKLEQVIDLENERITVVGGTLKIDAEYSEMGNCSRYWQQKVKVVHKIMNNVPSAECEIDGKRYKTCEEGCPIWKSNEDLTTDKINEDVL